MKSVLYVVGLGPAGLDAMTIGDYRLMKEASHIYFRTFHHPCAQSLLQEGIKAESFDSIYEQEPSFERVYEQIVNSLEKALSMYPEVVYAVPGHPDVAERSVQLIRDKLSQHYDVRIRPALSFLDPLFSAVGLDPIDGFLIRNYDQLGESQLTGQEWLIIPQVYDSYIASEVKLDLMGIYPDEASVYVVQALGSLEEKVFQGPLHQMDHQKFDHLTTIVVPPNSEAMSMVKLLQVMKRLRDPNGCPWDREQTHVSLKPNLIEETYEVIEAIESEDMYNLEEELGDLLLQIVFHAQVAKEAGNFEFQDVIRGIIQKLIRRHPHIFGDAQVHNSDDVVRTWDEIKKEEKANKQTETKLFDLPNGLPSLMLATKTQKKVAKIGFDWPNLEGPMAKIYEELKELEEAIANNEGINEEFGDLLFACVNVSRFLKLDAEDALRGAIHKFQTRYEAMANLAAQDKRELTNMSLEEMDLYWEKVKKAEKEERLLVK